VTIAKGLVLLSAVLCAGVAIACGGQVVFEEPNDGGSGGSGTIGPGGTKATTGTKNTVATTGQMTTGQMTTADQVTTVGPTTTSGGCSVPVPPPQDCMQACSTLYACGQTFCGGNQQLCPAFTPNNVSQNEFVMGCFGQCQNQMALISLINPNACDETIDTLIAVAGQFEQLCEVGF
jgi:hypothetical protein